LLDMAAAWRRNETPVIEEALITALSATLEKGSLDAAFAAEALSLPGEAFLADKMEVADFDAIHAVRDIARMAIGRALAPRLRATYDNLTDPGAYQIDGRSIGRRALRNTCLAYLVAAQDPDAIGLAKAQFDAAGNMTDVLAALSVLNGVDCSERAYTLATFYAEWRHDPLVLDKWFAIQAMSPLPGTLAAVRALTAHPDFDLTNPNRVRSVVGSFAGGNQVRFHDASGAGYRFLAETVKQLDPLNGQIAARLVQPLGQWRRVDAARQPMF
jgi:aminopeptidase N